MSAASSLRAHRLLIGVAIGAAAIVAGAIGFALSVSDPVVTLLSSPFVALFAVIFVAWPIGGIAFLASKYRDRKRGPPPDTAPAEAQLLWPGVLMAMNVALALLCLAMILSSPFPAARAIVAPALMLVFVPCTAVNALLWAVRDVRRLIRPA
jgi:hypothetical protein